MARDLNPDFKEARKVGSGFSDEYRGDRGLGAVGAILQERAAEIVEQYWHVIEAIAQALLAKAWEPVKPLKSAGDWATAAEARYLPGEEIVAELKRWEISALCVDEC